MVNISRSKPHGSATSFRRHSPKLHLGLWLAAAAVTIMIMTASLPASAALGGDASSVQTDQVHMQGSLRITRAEAYTVHEIRAATGTLIREYVSPAGKVFAVAWEGPFLPDMKQLLGAYFEQFAQAAQAQGNGRAASRPLHIEQPGLVVDLSGHMRSYSGRAYIPEMLPQALRAEEIR